MKSIAYTLSVLLLGATFAQADAPSESKDTAGHITEAKAPADDKKASTDKAPTGKVVVIEEEEVVEDNDSDDSDESKASDKSKTPAAPAKK